MNMNTLHTLYERFNNFDNICDENRSYDFPTVKNIYLKKILNKRDQTSRKQLKKTPLFIPHCVIKLKLKGYLTARIPFSL